MKLFPQLYHCGQQANTHDVLKALAMLIVLIDHTGLYMWDTQIWFRVIGRAAAPLFFFVVGTPSQFRFKLDILMYGVILTLSNYFLFNQIYINILINFILIKGVLAYYNPMHQSGLGLVILFVLLALLNMYLNPWLEYGSLGLLFAIGGRLISQKDPRAYYWIISTLIIYYLFQSTLFHFTRNIEFVYTFLCICVALALIMCSFRLRVFELPTIIRIPTLLISRYSLEFYVLQLLVFQMISVFIK